MPVNVTIFPFSSLNVEAGFGKAPRPYLLYAGWDRNAPQKGKMP